MTTLLISSILLLLYGLLINFYWRGWRSLTVFKPIDASNNTFISVIIPARNEEKNIGRLLQALKYQSYPTSFFEIIVVDDYSDDRTTEVVNGFPLDNLQLIQPNADSSTSSKKKAIESAIAIAKGELIVTTDADCIPHTDWLKTLNAFYTRTNASFIAAPVKFTHDNSLLQIFQAIDFLTLQGITAASVSTNFHTMCNGANLAYKKQSFIEVNGYEDIDKVATGDDMLLMYKIWKKDPDKVYYLKSDKAIVSTAPMFSWKDFIMQRKRWASKTLVYDDYRIIAVLFFVYILNCWFIALLVFSFFNKLYWFSVLGYWIIKTIIEAPFVNSVSKFYGEQKLMRYFFFFQPLHIFYTVFVGMISQFGKYEWKGRKTK
jgi:cellulose synthase/poly-beta-1,6-N-acetylglucosamine synthase-like glycosyltransferase